MKKIPFNLQDWLSDKSQKVITRDGRPVEILKTNMPGELPLLVLYDGNDVERVSTDGKYQIDYDGMNDLFLVTEDEPLTEFEKTVSDLCWRVGMGEAVKDASQIKREADKLLSIARKQLKAEGWEYTDPLFKKVCEEKLKQEPIPDDIAKRIQDHWWEMLDSDLSDAKTKKQRTPSPALTKIVENLTPEKLEKTKKEMEEEVTPVFSDDLEREIRDWWLNGWKSCTDYSSFKSTVEHFYNLGKSEALKDLPKWKTNHECGSEPAKANWLVKRNNGFGEPNYFTTNQVLQTDYFIPIEDLEKLPKE